MNKAKMTSPEEMDLDKIRRDMSMSPKERVEAGLRLSELAMSKRQSDGAAG